MPNINGVLARVFVSDLDAAIPLYQQLAGVAEVNRFTFRDVQLASVGPFLLLAGNTAAYRDRVATILVSRLPPIIDAIESAGGQIVEGPSPAPNGARLIARHPDGSIFEYIERARS
jgi:predicted enzyme related to lactoylglutathione lyase